MNKLVEFCIKILTNPFFKLFIAIDIFIFLYCCSFSFSFQLDASSFIFCFLLFVALGNFGYGISGIIEWFRTKKKS